MVKIVGLSKDEIREQGRISKLERITKRLLPQAKVTSGASAIDIYIEGDLVLLAYEDINKKFLINVYQPQAFESAIKIAEAYEKAGEPEITVKKNYTE